MIYVFQLVTDIYKLIGKRIRSGQGAMSLFVGLKGTAEELGIKAQNMWAFTGYVVSWAMED